MRTLDEYPALELLESRGIPAAARELAESEDAAVAAAARIGYPVVFKVSAPEALHKTEIGGVVVGIRDEAEARAAYRDILERAASAGIVPMSGLRGVLVQEMVKGGAEFILGGYRDPGFGPVVMVGLGGIFTELLKEAAFRLAPVDEAEALRMVLETRARVLAGGFRGAPPLDLGPLCSAIAELSRMMSESEEIAEFDVNPFVLTSSGGRALDALFKYR